MSKSPYETTEEQLAVAIGYKNKAVDLIAEEFLPRVPVGKKNFKYNQFNKTDAFKVPDTHVGRKSELNMASFGSSKVSASCEDYGLTDVIPNDDIPEQAGEGLPSAILRSTAMLTSLIHLDREVRVAAFGQNPANYADKVTHDNDSSFGNPDVNPIPIMLDYLNTPLVRPNTLTFGTVSWAKFRTNPHVVKAAHGNSGDSGVASRQAVMDLLEVNKLLVGNSFVDIAKKGKAMQRKRTWGDVISATFQGEVFDAEMEAMTWAFAARFGGWVAGSRDEPKIGLRGGVGVKVGETVGEVLVAKDAGFLISDATAYVAP